VKYAEFYSAGIVRNYPDMYVLFIINTLEKQSLKYHSNLHLKNKLEKMRWIQFTEVDHDELSDQYSTYHRKYILTLDMKKELEDYNESRIEEGFPDLEFNYGDIKFTERRGRTRKILS
jgi:hypothetical protein